MRGFCYLFCDSSPGAGVFPADNDVSLELVRVLFQLGDARLGFFQYLGRGKE
jgi:hypothetical protein